MDISNLNIANVPIAICGFSNEIVSKKYNIYKSRSLQKINTKTYETELNKNVLDFASSIYTELENIAKLHGDDSIKKLIPIVVIILEELDEIYKNREKLTVQNDFIKEENVKLLSQYESEKKLRLDRELVI
jgi:hypothetical protein